MASPVVDVYVKLPSGRTSVLNLMPTDPVRKINEQIGKEEGLPASRVRIKYQGKILKKSETIGYLGIRPETILKAEFIVPKDITVYVKVAGGSSLPVRIQTTDTVRTLICAIERLESFSEHKVKDIKHSGQTHHPSDEPLFELGISEESTIDVVLRGETTDDSGTTTNSDEPDEGLMDAVMSSFQANGKAVEVVFSFDTTGSMSQYLHQVRQKLRQTCERLLSDIRNIRIGLIAHGDYCDCEQNYVITVQDLTSDVDLLVKFAEDTGSTSGGDSPECYEWVLHKAQQLDWSEDSAKALVVIGDSEPHPPSYTDQNISWHTELDILRGMDVKVYGVFCSAYSMNSKYFYQELAERTGGCHLKLDNFNLITEMFIGVCYKESHQDQLENFTEELRNEGKLTEETADLMKQLEEAKPKSEPEETSRPNYMEKHDFSWWNFKTDDTLEPEYKYNAETDKWSINRKSKPKSVHTRTKTVSSSSSFDTDSPISAHYVSKHRKQKKKGCSIM